MRKDMLKGLLIVAMVMLTVASARAEWRYFGEDRNPDMTTQAGITGLDKVGSLETLASADVRDARTNTPRVFDIDDDGINELVTASDSKLVVYDENQQIQAEKEIGEISSDILIYNVNLTNDYVYEVTLVVNYTEPTLNSYEIDNTTINLVASFSIANPIKNWSSLVAVVAKEAGGTRLGVLTGERFMTYERDGTPDVDLILDSYNDTIKSALFVPIGEPISDIWGDWDNDGDTDFAFWHNSSIYVVDENGNIDLKKYGGTGWFHVTNGVGVYLYRPIVFVNLDGGNYELATTTGHTADGGRSYLLIYDAAGTQLVGASHFCDPVGGDPDAGVSNVIAYDWYGAGGPAEFEGDEVIVAWACQSACSGCGGDGVLFEVYNENGLIDGVMTNYSSDELDCPSISRGQITTSIPEEFFIQASGEELQVLTIGWDTTSDGCSSASPCLAYRRVNHSGYCDGLDDERYKVLSDINNDGKFDIIEGTEANTKVCLSSYANSMPDLTGFDVNTGSPICIYNVMTYSVLPSDYSDAEGDNVALNIDCYGNLSLTGWSSFGASPTQQCNYTVVGTYNPIVYLTDSKHPTQLTESITWVAGLSVTVANCFESGEGGISVEDSGATTTGNWTAYGVPANMTEFKSKGLDAYESKYFDWEGQGCESWTWFRGLCPFWKWGAQGVSDLWAWFWSSFLFIILIGLFIIFVVLVGAHTVRQKFKS
jgi:hypothetical protein